MTPNDVIRQAAYLPLDALERAAEHIEAGTADTHLEAPTQKLRRLAREQRERDSKPPPPTASELYLQAATQAGKQPDPAILEVLVAGERHDQLIDRLDQIILLLKGQS